MEWLNRIGIILNFIAGFMLAPELIGLERIRKFEMTLKTFARLRMSINKRMYKNFQDNAKKFSQWTLTTPSSRVWLIGVVIIALCAIIYFVSRDRVVLVNSDYFSIYLEKISNFISDYFEYIVISYLIYVWISGYYYFRTSFRFPDNEQKKESSYLWAVRIILFRPIFPVLLLLRLLIYMLFLLVTVLSLGMMIISTWILFKIPIYLSLIPAIIILRILEGKDRLRAIVVYIGVVFFILGNLMQLIATF